MRRLPRSPRRRSSPRRASCAGSLLDLSLQLAGPLEGHEACELACHFAVAELGYPLVWVSRTFGDEPDIFPEAVAGPASGFVDEIVARQDESPLGRGPAGTALREQRAVISADLAGDPAYQPWAAAAARHGLRAKAAFPLVFDNRARAVLNVYASAPLHFTPAAIWPLEQLTQMLALALQRSRLMAQELDKRQDVERRLGQLEAQQGRLAHEFTQRLEAEEAELRTQENQRRMLHEMALPIAVAQNRRHAFANRAYCEMLGYAPDELMGKPVEITWLAELTPEQEHCLKASQDPLGVGPANCIMTLLGKDGARIVVERHLVETEFNGQPAVLWADIDITERERSRQRLELAIAASRTALWEYDIQLDRMIYDATALRFLGLEASQLDLDLAETIQSISDPAAREAASAAINAILSGATDELDQVWYSSIQRDGEPVWQHIRGRVVEKDAQGRPLRVAGSFTDITESRRQEQALRESEARLRSAIEGVGDAVWDWDPRTNAAYFSPSWRRMMGYTAAQVMANYADWASSVHPDDLTGAEEALRAHFAGETPQIFHKLRMRHGDSGWRWILARGRVIEWAAPGQPARVVGTHIDISELEELQANLRTSEEQFRLMAEYATDIISRVDADGTVRYISPAVERLLGFTPQELIGTSAYALIHPQDMPALFALQGSAPGSTLALRYRSRRKDGVYVQLDSGVRVLEDGSVNISRLIG